MGYAFAVADRSIGGGGDIFVSALRSSGSKLPRHRFFLPGSSLPLALPHHEVGYSGAASRPSGDKSPRHKGEW
jgi:hypothetical protein